MPLNKSAPTYLEFPFQYTYTPFIGKIFYPYIPVKLQTKKGIVEFSFLVDTGADFTTLPLFMASQLDINLKKCSRSTAEGIGRFKIKTWLTEIKLIFPKGNITVRASITNENSTPLLLGRIDLLDVLYNWNFNSQKKLIEFIKV